MSNQFYREEFSQKKLENLCHSALNLCLFCFAIAFSSLTNVTLIFGARALQIDSDVAKVLGVVFSIFVIVPMGILLSLKMQKIKNTGVLELSHRKQEPGLAIALLLGSIAVLIICFVVIYKYLRV